MSYLITGGSGFVGSNLAAHLIRQGEKVTVFDNLSRDGAFANLTWLQTLGPFLFMHGDVRNADELEEAIRQPGLHTVFHLASQVAMTTSLRNPRRDFEINVVGTLNVLEAMRIHAPQVSLVYASSNKVYGNLGFLNLVERDTRYEPRDARQGVNESAPIEFHTPYGCSKGAADQYVLDYARVFGMNTIVLRYSTVYGGRQFANFDQGWVGWFCQQALELAEKPDRPKFTISGDGKQVRDLVHASDAVACYVAAARHMKTARGQAFNIGGGAGNSMSLLELFKFLEGRLGVKMDYEQLPWRQSDQKYFVADVAKAGELLEWSPKISKEQGLEATLEWEKSRLAMPLHF
jgi:CDP-paratose 2-epimerase